MENDWNVVVVVVVVELKKNVARSEIPKEKEGGWCK